MFIHSFLTSKTDKSFQSSSLNCVSNLGHPVKNQLKPMTRRTCQLHTESPQTSSRITPETFCYTNHHFTMFSDKSLINKDMLAIHRPQVPKPAWEGAGRKEEHCFSAHSITNSDMRVQYLCEEVKKGTVKMKDVTLNVQMFSKWICHR